MSSSTYSNDGKIDIGIFNSSNNTIDNYHFHFQSSISDNDSSSCIKSPLDIMMIGAVLDCLMSFIPLPRDIVRMDEVVMSSREMKQNKIPTWDTYLMESPSSISVKAWNEMRHSESSLRYVSTKRIPISKMSLEGRRVNDNRMKKGMFANILLEKMIIANLQKSYYYLRERNNNSGYDDFLVEFALACPNLEDINLSVCHGVTSVGLKLLSQYCPKLKGVYLNRCISITDAGVIALSKGCVHLQTISFSHSPLLTDAAIIALSEGCVDLQKINISACRLLTDAAVIALSKGCHGLMDIDLSSCESITDAAIRELSKGCVHLQKIDISCCQLLTNAAVIALSKGCHVLVDINLSSCELITNAAIKALSKGCVHLQKIDMTCCRLLTDAAIIALSKGCHGLIEMDAVGCHRLTNASLVAVGTYCCHLKILQISGTCTDAAIQNLREILPKLTLRYYPSNIEP